MDFVILKVGKQNELGVDPAGQLRASIMDLSCWIDRCVCEFRARPDLADRIIRDCMSFPSPLLH